MWVDPLGYDGCSGTAQSPIDLIGGPANNSNGGFGDLTFSDAWYDKVEGELFDNGHTGNLIKEFFDWKMLYKSLCKRNNKLVTSYYNELSRI